MPKAKLHIHHSYLTFPKKLSLRNQVPLKTHTLLRASAVVGVTGGLLMAMQLEVREGAVSTLGASVSSPFVFDTPIGKGYIS